MSHTLTARYDRAAPGWADKIRKLGFVAAYDSLVAAALPPPGPLAILDAGTGTGDLSLSYLRRCTQPPDLTLLEPSEAMLRTAIARVGGLARITPHLAPIGTDRVPSGAFDVVLAGHVIEHCPDPDAALLWLVQRLRPGGTALFAISRPHWCTALVRLLWGNRALPPPDAVRALMASGLHGVRTVAFQSGPPSRLSMGYVGQKR